MYSPKLADEVLRVILSLEKKILSRTAELNLIDMLN